MRLVVKSFGVLSILLVISFVIDPALSMDDPTTLSTTLLSETAQDNANSKCISDLQYKTLSDYFIKEWVKEIQQNRLINATETLHKIAPNGDDRFVLDIVRETLKQSDFNLTRLLDILNQAKLPTTTLNGFLDIFTHLSNTLPDDRSGKTAVTWMDLGHFVRNFVDGHGNDIEISTVAFQLLGDVEDKARSAIFKASLDDILYSTNSKRSDDRVIPVDINFIMKSVYDNGMTVENITEALKLLYYPTMCLSLSGLYNSVENTVDANKTFHLTLKLKIQCGDMNLNMKGGSTFQKTISKNYFHFKNAYNNRYLQGQRDHNIRAKDIDSIIVKTVAEANGNIEGIKWKFEEYYTYTKNGSVVLKIKNEEFHTNSLRTVPCPIHEDEFALQVDWAPQGQHQSYGWIVEVDDLFKDRFRIKNDLTKSYLAANMDNNQSKVILVGELNAENYDSVHWTLETITENANVKRFTKTF